MPLKFKWQGSTPLRPQEIQARASLSRHYGASCAALETAPRRKQSRRLEKLCNAYWYPLYAYLRRVGRSPHDAQDLTQAFFAHLLEKNAIQRAHPDKGRFRCFLIGALKRFVSDESDKARAQKRGGGRTFISLDAEVGEHRFQLEPVDMLDPQKIYECRWAMALLERVFGRLQNAYAAKANGRGAVFSRLQIYLREGKDGGRYAEAAASLGMEEGAVKVEVLRMRKMFRELFRDEIAQTVEHVGDIEDEVRHLFTVLRGPMAPGPNPEFPTSPS
jgi:RNA polymerase sigma-70 factor (ECF subfamily)